MADVERFVKIVFGGVDQTGTAFKSLGSNMQGLERGISSFTSPMASLTTGILKLDAAVLGLGATFLGFATNEAGKFQDATSEIYTLISATPEEFERFQSDILTYAQTSTKSIEDINGAVYSAISAGVQYADALDLLRQSEQLSIAGKAELTDTTVVLASTVFRRALHHSQAGPNHDAGTGQELGSSHRYCIVVRGSVRDSYRRYRRPDGQGPSHIPSHYRHQGGPEQYHQAVKGGAGSRSRIGCQVRRGDRQV